MSGRDEERWRAAERALRGLTEERRRAIVAGVRGTLAADGLELTSEEEELLLAYACGDISGGDLLAPN